MHTNPPNFRRSTKVIYIGNTRLTTKLETRAFLRKHRESGFLNPSDAAALQVFFKVKTPVCVQYNHTMHQHELWCGGLRLNSKHAIDYAFLRDDDIEQETRLKRAHKTEKMRNAIHFEGGTRFEWLKNNSVCCMCDSTEALEVDHVRPSFIQIVEAFGCDPTIPLDEEAWKSHHDGVATYQTLCKTCHHATTAHRKKLLKVLSQLTSDQSKSSSEPDSPASS